MLNEIAYNDGQNATTLLAPSRSRIAVGGRATLPTKYKPIPPLTERQRLRFISRVAVAGPDDCWPWQRGKRGQMLYGAISFNNKGYSAHIVAFVLHHGRQVREGLCLDHLCSNPACCNPSHLEEVTVGENTLRGRGAAAKNKRATHCKLGHPFTPDNTYHISRGERMCKACCRARYQRKVASNT